MENDIPLEVVMDDRIASRIDGLQPPDTSVPNPIFIPRFRKSRTSQNPLCKQIFEFGQ